MDSWIKFNGTLKDFRNADLCVAGVVIRIPMLYCPGEQTEYLIGHMNELGGVCDDCKDLKDDQLVESYRVVWKAN